MTATDELRDGLTKRGIKWRWEDERTTYWYVTVDGEEWGEWTAIEMGGYLHLSFSSGDVLTPAQAIAATIGSDDTFTREDVEGAFVSGYSLGLDMFDNSKPDNEKGWNQNERDMDEEMEELGWVRKDAATLGTGTCHIVKASRKYVLSDGTELFEDGCSVCNGYIGEGDNYCPNCGRKVVDE